MSLTGYAPEEVNAAIPSVISAYNNLFAALNDEMQNQG